MSRILGRGMDTPVDHHSVELQPPAPPRWSAGSSHGRQANAYETLDDDRSSYIYSPDNRSQRSMREPSSPPAQPPYYSGSSIAPYAYPPPPPPPPPSYSPMYTAAPGASVAPIPHDALEPSPPQVFVYEDQRKPFYRRLPWLSVIITVVLIVMFIVTMGINNCPAHIHAEGQYCVLPWLGPFAFEPLNINPMLGPTSRALLDLGALSSSLVRYYSQGWRLLTAMWLHAGVVHIISNLLAIYFLMSRLEKEFGLVRTFIVYLVSGFCGAVFSCLFLTGQVSVGASGALFGLVGASLSELLINWNMYSNRMSVFITLLSLILINLAIGLLPYIDNFAHLGGLIAGFLLGFVFFPKPQPHFFDLRSSSAVAQAAAVAAAGGRPATTKFTALQTWLRIGAALIFVGLFTASLVVLFRGDDVAGGCPWCKYLSCIPTKLWTCDNTPPNTQGGGPVCKVLTYANGTGAMRCSNDTSVFFPNLTAYTNDGLKSLCTSTCANSY